MKCLDTRWLEETTSTIRRHLCDCGVRGRTIERWDTPPAPTPIKVKKLSVVKPANPLWTAMSTPPTIKKHKHVAEKRKPARSEFDAMDEDYSKDDYGDLGIDLPRDDSW